MEKADDAGWDKGEPRVISSEEVRGQGQLWFMYA